MRNPSKGFSKGLAKAPTLDTPRLFAFLRATQPEAYAKLALADDTYARDINRTTLLAEETDPNTLHVENESFKRFVGDMVYAITNP